MSTYFSSWSSNICNDFDLYKDKIFHEPIIRSLDRFVGRRILDSPAIASLDFSKILFPEQVVSHASNSQQSWRTDWIDS